MKWTVLIAIAALTLTSCAPKDEPRPAAPAIVEMKSPAGDNSEAPSLAAGPDGQIYLSWVEPGADGQQTLRFSTRTQGEWSAPQTIAQGNDWFVSGVDWPTLTVFPDGTLAADWFTATEIEKEAYDTKVSFSRDKGATWSDPISPHRDKKKRQHGFLSLVPFGPNQLTAIWLDGKNLPEDLIGDMALVSTTISADGALGAEMELDSRVCECCHTSITATPDGLIAVYRDRTDKEVRDISIVRYSNGAWSTPEPLTADGWEIDACPVNGPSISSNGSNVAVAWFTAPMDQVSASVLMSSDGGKTFGKAVRIDEGNALGHVDVLSLPSGAAIASWLEQTAGGARVRLRQIDANGTAGSPIAVADVDARFDGVTQIERSGNDVVAAWTDSNGHVRTTLITP